MMNMFSAKKKNLLILLVTFIIGFGLLAGCSTDDTNGTDTSDNSNTSENKTSKSDPKKGDVAQLKFGETGEVISNWTRYEVTVKDVEFQSEYEGNAPNLGHFVIFTVEYKNTSGKTFNVEDLLSDPELQDGIGNAYKVLYWEGLEVDLAPGETVEGKLVWDHRNTEEYKLAIGDDFYGNVVEYKFSQE